MKSPTYRFLLCSFFAAVLFVSIFVTENFAAEFRRLFIGTYTDGDQGGKGIYTCRFDLSEGEFTEPELAAACDNPSFLLVHPTKPRLYAVGSKGKTGILYAFTYVKSTGRLTPLDQRTIPGRDPCHLCLCHDADLDLDTVIVANYSSGNVVSFPIFANGKIGKPASDFPHAGKGPNAARQEMPHPHGAYFEENDGKTVAVPDLGIDKVAFYEIDLTTAKLTPKSSRPFLNLPKGGGPRHMAYSQDIRFAYVNNELTSTVSVFELGDAENPPMIQDISTLPGDVDGSKDGVDNSTAEIAIAPSGNFLYVSNRGHDSLAVFALDRETGLLSPIEFVPSGGRRPRFFAIDPSGQFLFSCNKETGNVVVFSVNRQTGKLTQTRESIEIARPVCIGFAP